MTDINFNIDEFVDNFEKVIIFKTCTTIKNIYKSIDNYYAAVKLLTKPYHTLTDSEIHIVNKFNDLFQLDKLTVEKIITKPRIDGKQICITKQVLNQIKERGNIKIFNHGTIRYKSGKNFSLLTKYTIDISVIKTYFNNENVFNTNSDFYTKKQHKLIDKFILNYKKEKPIMNTTKSTSKKLTKKPTHPENDIIDILPKDTTTKFIDRLTEAEKNRLIGNDSANLLLQCIGENHKIKATTFETNYIKYNKSNISIFKDYIAIFKPKLKELEDETLRKNLINLYRTVLIDYCNSIQQANNITIKTFTKLFNLNQNQLITLMTK